MKASPHKTALWTALWAGSFIVVFLLGQQGQPPLGDTKPPARTATNTPPATTRPPRASTKWKPILPARTPPPATPSRTGVPSGYDSPTPFTPSDLQRTLQDNDRVSRAIAFARVLRQTDTATIRQALLTAQDLAPGYSRTHESLLLMQRWGELDGASAIAFLDAWEGSPHIAKMYRGKALAGWVKSDPDAALAWTSENNEGSGFKPLLATAISELAYTDLERATTLLEETPPGHTQNMAFKPVMNAWLRRGPAALTRWIDSLEEPSLKKMAIQRTAGQLGKAEQQDAVDWILGIEAPDLKKQAVLQFAGAWSWRNPREAVAWAATLEDETLRKTALDSSLRIWMQQNPAAMADWLVEQPESPSLDKPIQQLVTRISHSDPETALAWTMKITDPKMRHDATQYAIKQWTKWDPEAAALFLNSP